MATSKKVKLGLTRFGYVQDLFKTRTQESGAEKYGTTIYVAKTDTTSLKMLEDLVIEASVAEGWGDAAKVRDLIGKGLIKMPILDGDGRQGMTADGTPKDGHAGHFFIRASSGANFRPQVVDENVQPIATFDPARFKSGDYGYPVVSAFSWDHPKTGKGVSINIDAVQKIKSGDSLGGGGGVDTDKFFKAETVAAEKAPDETKGGAGAGGLFG